MKKMIGFLLAGVLLPLLPLQAQQEEEERVIVLKQPVRGMKYNVYLDEECQNPYMNEDEEKQIILESDEEGRILIPEMSEITLYIKQSETVPGYFMDPEVYELNYERNELEVYPINVNLESSGLEEKVFDVYEENSDEVMFQADFDKNKNLNLFEAGKKYILKKNKQEKWTLCSELSLKIPVYPKEIHLKCDVKTYCGLRISFESILQNGKYGLFLDREGNNPVRDIYEQETVVCLDQQKEAEFFLEKGKVFLKEIETPSGYYRQKEPVEILLSEKTENNLNVEMHLSEWRCVLRDAENGSLLDGTIIVKDEKGDCKEVTSGSKILLFPGKFYTFETAETEDGYYHGTMDKWKVPEYEPENQEIDLNCNSFFVNVNVKDADTGQKLKGGRFAIYDENDNRITEFTAGDHDNKIGKLKAGKNYRIHQIRLLDSFLPVVDHLIQIPEKGESNIETILQMKGYTTLTTGISDSETGNLIKQGDVAVYMDENCTLEASDILQQERTLSDGTKEVHLPDGTYFLKMKTVSKEWYWNSKVHQIKILHEKRNRETLWITTERVDMAFRVKDSFGNELSCFEVTVTDGKNQKLGTLNLKESNSLKEAGIYLSAEEKYYSQLHHTDGNYVYDEEKKPFMISHSAKGQFMEETAIPYVSVSIMSTDPSSEAAYMVYSDEKCTIQAENVKKNKSNDRWNLKDGEYWLLQQKIHGSFYAQKKAEKIIVSHLEGWNRAIVKEEIPVTYMIRNVDEENRLLSGSTFEIYDENESLVDRFHTYREEMILTGKWLEAGKTYTLHEIVSPEGYQKCIDMSFTVPLNYTGKIPVTTIEHSKKRIISLPSVEEKNNSEQGVQKSVFSDKTEKNEPEHTHNYAWMIIAGAIVMIAIMAQKKGNR